MNNQSPAIRDMENQEESQIGTDEFSPSEPETNPLGIFSFRVRMVDISPCYVYLLLGINELMSYLLQEECLRNPVCQQAWVRSH